MGKVVLIGLVIIIIILSTIFVSLRNRTDHSVDDLALRDTQNQSKLLANYAIQFGIQTLNDKDESPNSDDFDANEIYKKTFDTSFIVEDGIIDSLIYTRNDSNHVILDAYVTYTTKSNTVNSMGRAVLEESVADSIVIGNVANALSAKGKIEIQGKTTSKKGIHGDVLSEDEILYQNPQASIDGNEIIGQFPAFDEIFGCTLEEMKAYADYVGTDPNPVEGITYVEGDFGYNTSNGHVGSGILVVEGDLKITGTIDFTGIIWVTGEITGLGNGYIFGAIFAAGIDMTETGGSFLLEFDSDLTGSSFSIKSGSGDYKVLAIYEFFRE